MTTAPDPLLTILQGRHEQKMQQLQDVWAVLTGCEQRLLQAAAVAGYTCGVRHANICTPPTKLIPADHLIVNMASLFLTTASAGRHRLVHHDALTQISGRETALFHDIAVMAFVTGVQDQAEHAPEEFARRDDLANSLTLYTIDRCLALPDVYPAINSVTSRTDPDIKQWRTRLDDIGLGDGAAGGALAEELLDEIETFRGQRQAALDICDRMMRGDLATAAGVAEIRKALGLPPPADTTTYLVVTCKIVGSEGSWTFDYRSPLGQEFTDRQQAIDTAVKRLGHDDFNIATLYGGRLAAIGFDMNDFDPKEAEIDDVARQLNLQLYQPAREATRP